jgi:hypothetical protein
VRAARSGCARRGGREPRQQRRAIAAANPGVQRQQRNGQRGGRHQRHLAGRQPPLRAERADGGGQPQDQKQVGNVGADDVAERHVRGSAGSGQDADHQLRRRGAEGHHRQSHDHRRHPERGRQARGTAYEQLAAREQRREPGAEGEKLERHRAVRTPGTLNRESCRRSKFAVRRKGGGDVRRWRVRVARRPAAVPARP